MGGWNSQRRFAKRWRSNSRDSGSLEQRTTHDHTGVLPLQQGWPLCPRLCQRPRRARRAQPEVSEVSQAWALCKGLQRGRVQSFRCYNSGHLAKDCDEPDLCYHCNKRGHMSRDCPDGDMKTCFKCGGKGHIALNCPSPANSKRGEKGSGDDEVLEPEDL